MDIAQEGTRALDTLKELPPRLVFKDLFAVKAQTSLSAAAAAAGSAADNGVLLSGVSEVQQLTSAALGQPSLSKHQLTKLCQVCLALTFAALHGKCIISPAYLAANSNPHILLSVLDACTSVADVTDGTERNWCGEICCWEAVQPLWSSLLSSNQHGCALCTVASSPLGCQELC